MGSSGAPRGRKGLFLVLIACGLCALATPSAASAFPVGVGMFDDSSPADFKNISVNGGNGLANDISVTLDTSGATPTYVVKDAGVAVLPDSDGVGGCEQTLEMNVVRCPDPNAKSFCWGSDPNFDEFFDPAHRIVRRIQIWTNDQNDNVELDPSVTADLYVSGGKGDDHVGLPTAANAAGGNTCDSFVQGGDGNDVLWGGPGTDIQYGENGDDEIHPGTGNDYDNQGRFQGADGGAGNDTLSYEERTDPAQWVSIDTASSDSIQGTAGSPGGTSCKIGRTNFVTEFDTFNVTPTEQFETYVGTSGNDCIRGTRWAQTFRGGPGADQISGGQGVDTVEYSDKTSAVTATIGDDPQGGPGNDGVGDGTAGNTEGDNIYSDVENITGGPGDDKLTGQDRVPANYDPAGGYLSRSGQEGANTLNGAGGNLSLIHI